MASKFGFISLAVLLSVALQSARSQDPTELCGQTVAISCLAPVQMEYSGLEFDDLITKMKKEGLSGDCKRAKEILKCASTGLKDKSSYCSQVPPPVIGIFQDILTKEEKALKYLCEDQFTTMNKIHSCFLDNSMNTMMTVYGCIEPNTYNDLPPCQKISKTVNCLVGAAKDLCKTSDQETSVARTAFTNFVAPVNDLVGCQKFLKTRYVRDFMNFLLKR
jgi:hypothetical protein